MSARVVLISAPDEATMERVTALLRLAAGLAEGYAASRGGGACDPDAINRCADALVAGWVYDVRYSRPIEERTARMIAAALDLAGIACRVEVQS